MARQIEAQVFALDYRVVTKAFLRELVRNEVLAWASGRPGAARGRGGGRAGGRCTPVG